MERLGLDALAAQATTFDGLVARASYLDSFCSSTDWILPAHETLMPARVPWSFRWEGGFVAMAAGRHPRGFRYVEPLEASWGLACPVVAADDRAWVEPFAELCRSRARDWDVLVVCGVLDDAPVAVELARALAADYEVHRGAVTERHIASLAGGLDGFLSRRSRNLRRSLRRAQRRARDAGIEIDVGRGEPDALYARIQDVEARTWKGSAGVGINVGDMRAFYERMVRRLAAHGALRVSFARAAGRDVGYILGGVVGDTYRGLQFGYDADWATYGIGNLCQLRQVAALCEQGIARYDLGTTGGDYKRRWAERVATSTALLAVHR